MHDKIRNAFEDLGLLDSYPGNITLEAAQSLASKKLHELKDIPKFFLSTVLHPKFNGRCVFLLDQRTTAESVDDDDWGLDLGSEGQITYSFLDTTVLVFLCCDYSCKQDLAYRMHKINLSSPLLLPPISADNRCILQTSVLRGIAQDVGFDTRIPILSLVAANGSALNKTRIGNNLVLPSDCHKPFYDSGVEHDNKGNSQVLTLFDLGLIDAVMARPAPCTCQNMSTQNAVQACSCTFAKDLLVLNLYGHVGKYDTQRQFVCEVSTLVAIWVDTGILKGDDKTLNNIKEIVNTSNKVLILLTKEENSSFDDCKDGVRELQEALKGMGTEVLILYSRKDGRRDKVEQIRKNLVRRVNHIMSSIEVDLSLKERFACLNFENISTDEM